MLKHLKLFLILNSLFLLSGCVGYNPVTSGTRFTGEDAELFLRLDGNWNVFPVSFDDIDDDSKNTLAAGSVNIDFDIDMEGTRFFRKDLNINVDNEIQGSPLLSKHVDNPLGDYNADALTERVNELKSPNTPAFKDPAYVKYLPEDKPHLTCSTDEQIYLEDKYICSLITYKVDGEHPTFWLGTNTQTNRLIQVGTAKSQHLRHILGIPLCANNFNS